MSKKRYRNLCLASCAAFMAACSPQGEAPSEPAVRPAKLVTVEAASNRRTIEFPAVVRASRSTQLAFEVGGRLEELDVIEGAEVEQGQIIGQIAQRDYQNKVAQARSEYQNAESEYQRARRLAEQDAISKSVLEARRAQRDIAKAALDSAEKALSDTTLVAPYSGVISTVYVKQFQNVQPLEPVAILQSEGVEVLSNIPANIIAYVPQFKPVSTQVILDPAPDRALPATLKEASAEADPATQSYEVSFGFTPPEDLLILPGMTATLKVELELSELADSIRGGIAVPRSAINVEGDELFVWVTSPDDMTVSKRIVTTGSNLGENVAVTGGLEAGETIVAAGGSFIHEGMKLRPWNQ